MAIYKSNQLDQIFHALGDATRRRMLSMLTRSERLSASELAAPFTIAQPTASKHIKVLEQSALITRKIEGRTHYFQLRLDTLANAEDWLHRHRSFWADSLQRLHELAVTLADDD